MTLDACTPDWDLFTEAFTRVSILGNSGLITLIVVLLVCVLITRDMEKWKLLAFPVTVVAMMIGLPSTPLVWVCMLIFLIIFVVETLSISVIRKVSSGIRNVRELTKTKLKIDEKVPTLKKVGLFSSTLSPVGRKTLSEKLVETKEKFKAKEDLRVQKNKERRQARKVEKTEERRRKSMESFEKRKEEKDYKKRVSNLIIYGDDKTRREIRKLAKKFKKPNKKTNYKKVVEKLEELKLKETNRKLTE